MAENNVRDIKNKKLRDIRIESKLTQDDLAKALQITRSAYQHLEAKGNLSGDILYKLSKIFLRPIEDFIDEADSVFEPLHLAQNPPVFPSVKNNISEEDKEILKLLSTLSPEGKARVIGYIKGTSWSENNK